MKVNDFISSLELQTQSKETLRAYQQGTVRFLAFIKEKGLRINQVKPSTIAAYVKHLRDNHGRTNGSELAPATIARHLAVLHSFYEWHRDTFGTPSNNPVDRVRRPKVNNQAPSAIEEGALAKLIEGITDLRDKALALLLLYSGLRLAEICQLNKDSITLRRRALPGGEVEYYGTGEVLGKGRKRRQFIAGPKAVLAIREYLQAERMNDKVPALFISSRRTRMSCRAIQQVVDKWCKRLGLDHVHVHQFRHSFATRNVNAGMSSAVLKELMGHVSLATTQRYFSIQQERLAREYHAAMEWISKSGTA